MHEDEKQVLDDKLIRGILKKQASGNMAFSVVLLLGIALWASLSFSVLSLLSGFIIIKIGVYVLTIGIALVFVFEFYIAVLEFKIIKKREYKIVSDILEDISRSSGGYSYVFKPFTKRYTKNYYINTARFSICGNYYIHENDVKYHSNGDTFYLVVYEYAKNKTHIALAFNAKYYHLDNSENV